MRDCISIVRGNKYRKVVYDSDCKSDENVYVKQACELPDNYQTGMMGEKPVNT